MASFTTRVELHHATAADYVTLHLEMRREGFATTLTADNGSVVELPPAEYTCHGNVTRATVLAAAQRAAGRVVRSYAVLVTESVGWTWHNLAPAKTLARV